jgi:hypothetical protein
MYLPGGSEEKHQKTLAFIPADIRTEYLRNINVEEDRLTPLKTGFQIQSVPLQGPTG